MKKIDKTLIIIENKANNNKLQESVVKRDLKEREKVNEKWN